MKNIYYVLFSFIAFFGLSFFVSATYLNDVNSDQEKEVYSVSNISNLASISGVQGVNSLAGIIRSDMLLPNGDNAFNENILGEDSFSGYIVEFEETPVKVKESELKEELKENNEYIEKSSPFNPFRLYAQLFTVTDDSQVQKKVQQQRNRIESEHSRVKNRIFSELNQQRSITGNAVSFSDAEDLVTSEFKEVFNGVALNISAEEAKEIEKVNGVKRVQPNFKVKAFLQDSLPLIGATDVWKLNETGGICAGGDCLTGKGVKIAIIDTGVDYTHDDLGDCSSDDFLNGNCLKIIGGYDFVNGDEDPMDDHGHGTHVAGTAAGKGDYNNNDIYELELGEVWGVAPDAQILAYKVLSSGGGGYSEDIILAIEQAVLDGADIISMSLGGGGNPDDAMSTAVDNAVDAGVVAVIAAGNSGPAERTIGSPGTARKAITVGATDKNNILPFFSSRGPVAWQDDQGNEKILIKPDVVALLALISVLLNGVMLGKAEHALMVSMSLFLELVWLLLMSLEPLLY